MEAIRKVEAGPGVKVLDVPEPRPAEGQVLVRVAAAGICGSDLHVEDWDRGYHWMGDHLPVTLGHEFSGEIVALGSGVSDHTVGQRVTVLPGSVCGTCYYCRRGLHDLCSRRTVIGLRHDGAFAPLVAVPAQNCLTLPDSLSLPVAALTEPLAVCARAVDMAGVAPGDTVAILGPGMIGIGLMVMARTAGASRIIIAGKSRDAARLAVCRDLGADRTVDVDAEELVPILKSENEGEGVDVVLEATGHPASLRDGLSGLRRGGTVVALGIHAKMAEIDPLLLVRNKQRLIGSHGSRPLDWARVLRVLSREGERLRPIISYQLPISRGEEGFRLSREPGAVKVLFTPQG